MNSDVIRVCVVDDHEIVREGLRSILEKDPKVLVVAEAANGRDALALARAGRGDVMLLDIDMPGMDGLEVARFLQEERLSCKVVFLTMLSDPEVFNRALDLGVMGYVLKGSAASDISRAIDSVHRGSRFISSDLSELMLSMISDDDDSEKPKKRPGLHLLTEVEWRVLRLIAASCTSNDIADQLMLGRRTIDSHRANICAKLGLKGSHILLKYALENRSKLM